MGLAVNDHDTLVMVARGTAIFTNTSRYAGSPTPIVERPADFCRLLSPYVVISVGVNGRGRTWACRVTAAAPAVVAAPNVIRAAARRHVPVFVIAMFIFIFV
jgi:hypothetical protein